MIQMRPSRVLERLRAGRLARSTKINLSDSRAVEIAAMSGFDCIWLDMEHMPNTAKDIEENIRATKMFDCDSLVRVKRGSYSDLVYPLEMDATGIMVPHLMSAADAREVAHQTRFHPIGRRPFDNGTSAGAYCQIPAEDFLRDSNEQRFVVVQIEDPEPMEELEAIAQTDGIDMLFFGPADFSHGLGTPIDMGHPAVVAARKRIVEVARQYGKFAGTVATPDTVAEYADMGYLFLSIGADVLALADYFREMKSVFDRIEG